MNFHFYQIAVAGISVIMMYQGLQRYIKGKSSQTFLKLAVRFIVWGSMAAIAIFPDLSNIIAGVIGIEGNVNAVILTGFLLVFLIIFKLLSAIEKLEQDISVLTRKDSLEEIGKSTHKN